MYMYNYVHYFGEVGEGLGWLDKENPSTITKKGCKIHPVKIVWY